MKNIIAKNTKKENLEDSLQNTIKQFNEENQRLKLLEETDRNNIKQSQVTQDIEQNTPNISTQNRFEILGELLSATDMETENGEEEEQSFIQILKDKNNKK